MTNDSLYKLVLDGKIKSYSLVEEKADGFEDKDDAGFRNTEKLTIVLNSGESIVVDSFCSGVNENTSLFVSVK